MRSQESSAKATIATLYPLLALTLKKKPPLRNNQQRNQKIRLQLSELLNALKECYAASYLILLWIYKFEKLGVRAEMLSKTEIKFLKEPEAFNPEYARILRFRIKRKISKLKETLSLLLESEFSEEIASIITENCNVL